MDLRFKNRRAMVTVELAVTLFLIVIALFVTLGLFNNNLRDMVANSNFKNLLNGNGSRTFFSFFNKDYKNAQVYVQIMGEQGLQILRKKANNGIVSAVSTLSSGGGSVQNPGAFSTISYLSQIITVIMGNSIICNTMVTPSTAECNAPGMPGAKYNISVNGTSLVINPVGNSVSRAITLTTTGPAASLTAAKNASGANTKDKFKFISSLSSDNSSTSNALVRTIGYFSSVISRGGSFSASNSVDARIILLLNQITTSMTTANDICMGHTWIGNIEYQKTWIDGCSSDADVVNDSDLEQYNSQVASLTESITNYAAQAQCIAVPTTPGCPPAATTPSNTSTPTTTYSTPTTNDVKNPAAGGTTTPITKHSKVVPLIEKLPAGPSILPSYTANGKNSPMLELAYMPDALALATYKNSGAIVAGVSDSFIMTNPLNDTSNMIATYACRATLTDGSCPAGSVLKGSGCCLPPGSSGTGTGTGTGTTCPVDSYVTPSSTCAVCPNGLSSDGDICDCGTNAAFNTSTKVCVCENGGTFNYSNLTCSGGAPTTVIDNICKLGAGTCGGTNNSTITVSATNSQGSTVSVILSTAYIASPMTDARLSIVTSARAAYLQDRIKILKIYNQMFDVIWNGNSHVLVSMAEDNYNRIKSCTLLVNGLSSLANGVGLVSMNSDILTHTSKCTPAVK